MEMDLISEEELRGDGDGIREMFCLLSGVVVV